MRDFVAKWGYSYHEILAMPREKFAMIHGKRFLGMTVYKLFKKLKEETPDVDVYRKKGNSDWHADIKADKDTYKGCQLGVWDFGGQGEII